MEEILLHNPNIVEAAVLGHKNEPKGEVPMCNGEDYVVPATIEDMTVQIIVRKRSWKLGWEKRREYCSWEGKGNWWLNILWSGFLIDAKIWLNWSEWTPGMALFLNFIWERSFLLILLWYPGVNIAFVKLNELLTMYFLTFLILRYYPNNHKVDIFQQAIYLC